MDIRRQQFHELLDIVMDTNGLEERKRAKTGCLPTMFLSYSGHVNVLEVQLYPAGWGADMGDKRWRIDMDSEIPQETMEDIREWCKEAITDKAEVLRAEVEEMESKIALIKAQIEDRRRQIDEICGE